MNKPLSIAVVGNCQARPFAEIIKSLVPNVDIAGVAIVHLLRDDDEAAYANIFKSADLILAQLVSDNYPCTFVRNVNLKTKYGERVRIWPNLYFEGYNPELCYIRNQARKQLGGPLGDYHSKTIVQAWRRGLSVSDAIQLHHDYNYNMATYGDVPNNSLQELRNREVRTDVQIVDWICDHLWQQRLFFTFNHPAKSLLVELCERLLTSIGVELNSSSEKSILKDEPLGQFCAPLNPWVAKKFNPSFEITSLYHGREVLNINHTGVVPGPRRIYNEQDLVETYYKIYEIVGDTLAV